MNITKPVLTSEDRDTFRAILEGCASTPSIGVIANRFPWQSKMALQKLLDVAEREKAPIRMLSGGGLENFYDEQIAERLGKCKAAGCPFIRVLVWQKEASGVSSALLKLGESDAIELRISGTDEFAERIPHFLLVGEHAFRQEATHARFTSSTKLSDVEPEIPARIDFDDTESGSSLARSFDKIWGIE